MFTLPAAIGQLAFYNKSKMYHLLFKAASQTLLTIARNPKHLGEHIGMTMVLHTWGSVIPIIHTYTVLCQAGGSVWIRNIGKPVKLTIFYLLKYCLVCFAESLSKVYANCLRMAVYCFMLS